MSFTIQSESVPEVATYRSALSGPAKRQFPWQHAGLVDQHVGPAARRNAGPRPCNPWPCRFRAGCVGDGPVGVAWKTVAQRALSCSAGFPPISRPLPVQIESLFLQVARRPGVEFAPAIEAGLEHVGLRQIVFPFALQEIVEERQFDFLLKKSGGVARRSPDCPGLTPCRDQPPCDQAPMTRTLKIFGFCFSTA